MSGDWKRIEDSLQSTEDDEVKQALKDLQDKCTDTALDADASTTLLPLCMDKLQHHDINIRSVAMNILATQMRVKNWAMERLMSTLAKNIAQPNVLDLKASRKAGKVYDSLHMDVVYTITEIHTRHPSKLMPVFKPVAVYLVDCSNSSHREISTLASQFWGNLKVPPVPQKAMGDWLPPVFQKITKLIQALLNGMVYHEDYVQYLESQVSVKGRPRTSSLEYEKLSDLRNYAALGFEKICSIFTTEVTQLFKMHIQKWLKSSNWLEQEAIVLALGAYCQAMQGPGELKDLMPEIMSYLLEFYQSPHPLLKAITCFTMPHFMNVRVRGMKDTFGRMLRATLSLLGDDHCEVQDQALRSLATMMAFSERDLSAHTRKIVKALVNANDSAAGKGRHAYYECIGHTFGRLGTVLEEQDMKAITAPLIEHWNMFQWNQNQQAPEEEITSVCSALCVVAMFSRSAFESNNGQILDKVVPYINRLMSSANGHGDAKSDAITVHVVAYLDLLSAMYEGQEKGLNKAATKNNLPEMLLKLLAAKDTFREEVVQSSLALLGHLCKNAIDDMEPKLTEILEILNTHVESKIDNIRNNALWALLQIAKTCDVKNDKLFLLANQLIGLFMNLKAQEGQVINSALALMHMAKRWPDVLLKVVLKDEVFTHLCALLQTQFSREEEKEEIFSTLCKVVASNMGKVPKDVWIHFCAASAVLNTQDDKLRDEIKGILKDIRSTIGNAGWNKLNTMMGQQMAYNMRKKYKLY